MYDLRAVRKPKSSVHFARIIQKRIFLIRACLTLARQVTLGNMIHAEKCYRDFTIARPDERSSIVARVFRKGLSQARPGFRDIALFFSARVRLAPPSGMSLNRRGELIVT